MRETISGCVNTSRTEEGGPYQACIPNGLCLFLFAYWNAFWHVQISTSSTAKRGRFTRITEYNLFLTEYLRDRILVHQVVTNQQMLWGDTWPKVDCVSSGAQAVGEEGALSLQPGGVAEVGRLSWLEVVEVSPATAAARPPLAGHLPGLPPLHTLRGRVLQPGDTERLNTSRRLLLVCAGCHGTDSRLLSNSSHRRRVAADAVHAEGNVCWCGEGARHRPLHVFQATLRVCLQVCFCCPACRLSDETLCSKTSTFYSFLPYSNSQQNRMWSKLQFKCFNLMYQRSC